jgi:hypothetical protein
MRLLHIDSSVPDAGSASRALTADIAAPPGINYLDLRLKAGERWHYRPPVGHQYRASIRVAASRQSR